MPLSERAKRVVNALARTPHGLTRSELARELQVSGPTLHRAVKDLEEDANDTDGAWLAGSNGSGPKPGQPLVLGSRAGLVVGVDAGRRHVRATVADAHGTWLVGPVEPRRDLNVEAFDLSLFNSVADELVAALDKESAGGQRYRLENIRAIGIGVPTPVDRDGIVVQTFPSPWSGVSFPAVVHSVLEQKAKDAGTHLHPSLRIKVAKDADLGALAAWRDLRARPDEAERRYDPSVMVELAARRELPPSKDSDSLLFLKASNGVDASMICGGDQPFLGARGMAAQIGHLSLPKEVEDLFDRRGIKDELRNYRPQQVCQRCERRRCLENLASARAIVTQLQHLPVVPAGEKPASVDELIEQFGTDQPIRAWSREAVVAAGTRIGATLGEVTRLADPSVIIVGGLLACTGDTFMASLRRAFTETAFSGESPRIIGVDPREIKKIELQGAVDLALEELRIGLTMAS